MLSPLWKTAPLCIMICAQSVMKGMCWGMMASVSSKGIPVTLTNVQNAKKIRLIYARFAKTDTV